MTVAVSIAELIADHREKVAIDEAAFDDNGKAIDEDRAFETWQTEIAAFQAFCRAGCTNAADVQAKVRYVLDGTIGDRNTLVECLVIEEYGFVAEDFLRSLLVPDEAQGGV